jgi:hypothetical protein
VAPWFRCLVLGFCGTAIGADWGFGGSWGGVGDARVEGTDVALGDGGGTRFGYGSTTRVVGAECPEMAFPVYLSRNRNSG